MAYKVELLADAIDRRARNAKLVRHGLQLDIVGGRPGAMLRRNAAIGVIVPALASFERKPIRLPVETEKPEVTEADLQPAWRVGRRVLSAPVTLVLAGKRLQLTPAQLAPMLVLPKDAGAKPLLGGAAANRYFAKLDRTVSHPARNATFSVYGPSVRIVPAQPGLGLDVAKSSAAVFAAARRSTGRVARLSVGKVLPERGTAEAKAMGITGLVGSYETIYGGIPNRIHNVQLVAHLVDDKLIAPGATFSFNGTTGERTAAKGFLEAPVIINGEPRPASAAASARCRRPSSTRPTRPGCRSRRARTTRSTSRTIRSGRDATVDYPNIDLKFVNDTDHWLLLRTFVGSSSLVGRRSTGRRSTGGSSRDLAAARSSAAPP